MAGIYTEHNVDTLISLADFQRLTTGKIEKEYSSHDATAMRFISTWLKIWITIGLKNYDFCEYVKFGEISWKIDILSITSKLKFES